MQLERTTSATIMMMVLALSACGEPYGDPLADSREAVTGAAAAQGGDESERANVLLMPQLTLGPIGTLCGGATAIGTVTLPEPAPVGGGVVFLNLDNSAASVPASILVPAGAVTGSFVVTAGHPANTTTVHLGARYLTWNATPVSFTVLSTAAVTLGLPAEVDGGSSVAASVMLCNPAPPGGAVIALASNNADASLPATVMMPAGSVLVGFTIKTTPVPHEEVATISATYKGDSASGSILIEPVLHCGPGKQLCTCGNGAQACLSTPTQCLLFCKNNND